MKPYITYDYGMQYNRPEIKMIYCLDENNQLHSEIGPAIDFGSIKRWFWHGKLLDCKTQKEFELLIKQLIKLKCFE